MRCPSCNHDNSADALFCDACGAKFESLCATCGTTNQPGARFCKECGTRIAMESVPARPAAASTAFAICVTSEQPDASTPLDGERKTVTALFADIKGSTELMEELDPEEARAIIDPALKLMIEAVRRYDGYVVQSTGDGIFALFGAPLAHEDHPQRALYAALRMQEDLKRYSARLREAGNLPIEGRVGVNTGEVVVRSITTGEGQTEYTPIGHTTNLASRMQALAPTGSIAVSEQTRKFVEGYFQLKPLGPTKVKGVSEPVNVHEVTGLGPLRTRLQRAVGRGLTKFVGREREMETLRHAAELAKSGHGQIVAAMAEPGVGKSRLYYEFKATSQFGWMVLETFSISHGKASAYLPVIDLLRNYFRIAGEDDERTRREKVAGKITILDRSLDDTLPYLFSLLGIVEGDDPLAQMDGQIKKRRTLEAIKRILLRESLNQPLMVIFEDLHWIDEATQELLNLLADSIGTAKFLLLVNYRPEYSHKWNSKTYYTQLRLDPLGKESADEMLSALLGASPAPATQSAGASRERPAGDLQVAGRVRVQDELAGLKRMIIDRTEGNPFFMEEIVQSLFEDGVLHRNGAIRLARSMNAVKVPATVQGVLAARTDRLPAEEKELLQTLAVRGREFPLGLVRRVTLKPDDELERRLSRLQAGEFIYEQAAAGDVEYTFKHALTQEVAYNALLIERRKLLHERAGAALESLHTERLDDHFEELAHHYSSSDNIPKAVEYLRLASEQALKRSHHSEAITRAAAGLHLLGSLPEGGHRWEAELSLQLTLGYASMPALGYAAPEVGNAFDRAATLSRQVGTGKQTFAVIGGLWAFYLVRADQRRSHEFASELLEIALKEGSDVFAIDAHFALGVNLFWEGKFAESLKHLERGFVSRPDLSLVNIVGADTPAFSLGYAACCLWHLGFPNKAIETSHRALQRADAIKHPYTAAVVRLCLCILGSLLDHGLAEQEAENMIVISSEHGFPYPEPVGLVYRNCVLLDRETRFETLARILDLIGSLRQIGARLSLPIMLAMLPQPYGKMGNAEEGLSLIDDTLNEMEQTSEYQMQAEFHRLKEELMLLQTASNAVEAERSFRTAIDIARSQEAKSLELRATTSLARLLAKQGRRDEARAMLAEIYNWFTEGFDTADLKDAKALLEQP